MGNLARLFWLVLPILCGCGMTNSIFGTDPVSGGVNSSSSELAEIPLPSGLQRYPAHGFVNMGNNGNREGLETLRGHVSAQATAARFYSSLRENGWQLLASQQKGSRGIWLYGKGDEYLALVERPQGALVIAELWRIGKAGPDAAPFAETPEISIAPEEHGPLPDNEAAAQEPLSETWGKNIEEREL